MEDLEKPLILPPRIVSMLRGEVKHFEETKPLVELSIYAYQDGKNGVKYEPVEEAPGFPAWAAKCLDRFLRAAHKQGRVDAGLDRHVPVHFEDLEVKRDG